MDMSEDGRFTLKMHPSKNNTNSDYAVAVKLSQRMIIFDFVAHLQ